MKRLILTTWFLLQLWFFLFFKRYFRSANLIPRIFDAACPANPTETNLINILGALHTYVVDWIKGEVKGGRSLHEIMSTINQSGGGLIQLNAEKEEIETFASRVGRGAEEMEERLFEASKKKDEFLN